MLIYCLLLTAIAATTGLRDNRQFQLPSALKSCFPLRRNDSIDSDTHIPASSIHSSQTLAQKKVV